MTLQAIFYASNNTTIDASKRKKEEMLKTPLSSLDIYPLVEPKK